MENRTIPLSGVLAMGTTVATSTAVSIEQFSTNKLKRRKAKPRDKHVNISSWLNKRQNYPKAFWCDRVLMKFAIFNSFQMIVANELPSQAKRSWKLQQQKLFQFMHQLCDHHQSSIEILYACTKTTTMDDTESPSPLSHVSIRNANEKFIKINCIRTTIHTLCQWHKFKFLFGHTSIRVMHQVP